MKVAAILVLVLAICLVAAVAYARWSWQRCTVALHSRIDSARLPIQPARYDARIIEGLPAPVQRFFRAVLMDGQPMVAAARFTVEGEMHLKEDSGAWSPFTSSQYVVTHRPGFDWDARVRMVPGLSAFVHDSYAAGEGMLNARLLGLFTVADLKGTKPAAEGELLRWLAEAVWYPTALLPGQGVTWEPMDDTAARATLTDGGNRVSLEFHFAADGTAHSIFAPTRYHSDEGGVPRFMPWQGRFSAYALQGGMRIPMEGEVAWIFPDGPRVYWRGRVKQVEFGFAA